MKANFVKRLFVALVVCFLAAAVCVSALADSYTAGTMRLLHYDGTVEIEDEAGKARFVMENARFSSGESMRTGVDSIASVSLDDDKIVTLDAESRVEFVKESNAMKLTLTEGQLFLDVAEKLDENETLDIQTSTTVVGIRGTIVFMSDMALDGAKQGKQLAGISAAPAGDQPAGRMTTLGVLEGVATFTYRDPSGELQVSEVGAGQKATLVDSDGDGQAESRPEISELTMDDISGFVARQIMSDLVVYDRVDRASDLLKKIALVRPDMTITDYFDGDKEWTWSGRIELVAQSASKLFDGKALVRPSDVLVNGLPEDLFSIRVSAGGSRTDAGESANPIASYTIYNKKGEDVTEHFVRVSTVDGNLTVDPAPLTVWTGSAEKVYDGTPLTNPEAALRAYPGYEKDIVPWRNASYAVTEEDGGQTLYGLCGTVWVHGTNPLTGESREIELRAGQRMTVYLHSEDGGQSIEFRIDDMGVEDLPEDVLRLYADNPDLLAQACADTQWTEEAFDELFAESLGDEQADVIRQVGLSIEPDAAERLMLDCTNVRITIDTEITDYDGRALGSEEAHFTGVTIDESIRVTATGSQTEVGESRNTYKIDWGTANPKNYTLGEDLGMLVVLEPGDGDPTPPGDPQVDEEVSEQVFDDRIVFTAASVEKVYDGTPLTSGSVTVSGLPDNYTFTATAVGSQTKAGASDNAVSSYQIFDENGEDVTSSFPNIAVEAGTLTVQPLKLSLNLGGTEMDYSHEAFDPSASITYENGSHAGETIYGERVRSSGATIRFDLFTGDTILLNIDGAGTDAGTYTLVGSCEFPSGDSANFTLDYVSVTLTIAPRALTVTTGSASKVYDGTPLTSSEATVVGLATGESVDITATGSLTDVGTAKNTYAIDWGDVNPGNYAITEELGTLKVTANDAAITFIAGSAKKIYDGKPLTCETVTVSGLPAGLTFEAATSGSQTDAGSAENTVASYRILDGDGKDVTANFKNIAVAPGRLEVEQASLSIVTPTASKPYDGTPLTGGEAIVTGLADGETISVTTASLTDVGTATNIGDVDWGSVNPDNYIVFRAFAMLEVTANDAAVTFTAGSAEKVYDGQPLASEEVAVTGLPESLTYTAATSGSQTDAGTAGNPVASYQILDGEGKDVTAFFTNITAEPGALTVEPAPLTIATPSASKPYDGTPLTASEATAVGLVSGESVAIAATGSITDVGTATNTYAIDWGSVKSGNYTVKEELGTLEVTANGAAITFTAGSAEKVYDGQALVSEEVTVTGLPAGFTYTAVTFGSQTDAGESYNEIADYAILDGNGSDVTGSFTGIATANGKLIVGKAPLTIATGSASKAYDGTPLTSAEATAIGLVSGESVTLSATGSITEPGTADNTYAIEWDGAKEGNYDVAEALGTLEVTRNVAKIIVTAGSASKEYDASDLTEDSYTVEGLPDGFTLTATVDGSQYIAGTSENAIIDYTIYNSDGEDRTANFTNVVTVSGTLTVTKKSAVFYNMKAVFTYDGKNHSASMFKFGFLSADNVQWSDLKVTYPSYRDVGTYPTDFTVSFIRADLADKYEIEYAGWDGADPFQPLTIKPATLTVTTGSDSKVYDGAPLTAGASLDGLGTGDSATVTATGSVTDVGTAQNTYSIDWGSTNSANYEIAEDLGTLEVTPLGVEFDMGGWEDVYDAEPKVPKTAEGVYATGGSVTLKNDEIVFFGGYWSQPAQALSTFELVGGAEIRLTADLTAMNTGYECAANAGVYELPCSYEFLSGSEGNYDITFTNTAITVTPSQVELVIDGGTVAYDGAFHTGKLVSATHDGGASCSIFDWDSYYNVYPFGNDGIKLTVTGGGTNVGDYAVSCDYEQRPSHGCIAENLSITVTGGTLTIAENDAPIVFTAESADKMYDGEPLVGEVSVSGLPAGLGWEAEASGSQTDVGSSETAVASYKIFDADDNDVTAYFSNITTVSGTLTVTANDTPIVFTAESASKMYDGTPLSIEGVTASGLPDGLTFEAKASGSQTEVGSGENTVASYEILGADNKVVTGNFSNITTATGTLTVTANDMPITITAGSFNRVYHPSNDPTCNEYEVEGLPDGFSLDVTIEGSQYVAGTSDNVITKYRIYNGDGDDRTASFTNVTTVNGTLTVTKAKLNAWSYSTDNDVTSATFPYKGSSYGYSVRYEGAWPADTSWGSLVISYPGDSNYTGRDVGTYELTFSATIRPDLVEKYEVGELKFGTITIEPGPLTITTESAEKTYDGTPLTAGASVEGVRGVDLWDDDFGVTAAGSITEVGSATNGYTINWATVDPNNYTVVENLGTLTVKPATLTVITDSDTKVYDGTPLKAGARLVGLASCDDATVSATGTITDAGSVVNTYEIDWGTTNPANYTVVEELGVLSVTEGGPAPLTVITYSASRTYDGTPLTAGARLVGLHHDADATVIATGTLTDVGSATNTYEIDWGTTDSGDYMITENLGTLTVTPAAITVTTESASKTYDGTPLTAGASMKGLCPGDDAEVIATGSLTDAGSAANTYEINWGTTNPDNYTVTGTLGKLTVDKARLYIYTSGDWKAFDGEPLTNDYVYISGLASCDSITVTATGSITEVGSVENTYVIDWGETNPENYWIDEEIGWLHVLEFDPESTDEPFVEYSVEYSMEDRFAPKPTPGPAYESSVSLPDESDGGDEPEDRFEGRFADGAMPGPTPAPTPGPTPPPATE